MAQAKAKGSIILKILIVVLLAALVGTIMYPKKIWDEETKNTKICRDNMDRIFKAEMVFLQHYNNYTDSLNQLTTFFEKDSTKDFIREYFKIDTALAENVTDFLTKTDLAADLVIRNLAADTLMFAVIEAVNYDSNLAHVMLNRLGNTPLGDEITAKRSTGNNDVAILKELNTEFASIKVYEPIKDDDSLSLVFHRMMPEMPVGTLLDTLYNLNSTWAQKIDSAVFYTLDHFKTCPTVGREYKITVIDTSAIKYIDIECPIDSLDIEATKADFFKYRLGHRRIENHGKIETGEKSWAR
jgi:hypothetical protein